MLCNILILYPLDLSWRKDVRWEWECIVHCTCIMQTRYVHMYVYLYMLCNRNGITTRSPCSGLEWERRHFRCKCEVSVSVSVFCMPVWSSLFLPVHSFPMLKNGAQLVSPTLCSVCSLVFCRQTRQTYHHVNVKWSVCFTLRIW
jgi:hypothetical protein